MVAFIPHTLTQAPETALRMLDPSAIKFDAATYQFRSHGDNNGVTDKYRCKDTEWNPATHGKPILVHERLDGTLYVADGHHRLEFAQRLKAQGKGPQMLAAEVMREADGYTTKDVKVIAAFKNMQHGSSSLVESARVFKEAQSMQHMEWLPSLQMDKSNLQISYVLSNLSDASLAQVENQAVPVESAANVALKFNDPYVRDSLIDIMASDAAMIKSGFADRVQSNRAQATGWVRN